MFHGQEQSLEAKLSMLPVRQYGLWSSLPESVRSAETLASLQRNLKTYLFNISFYLLLTSLTL